MRRVVIPRLVLVVALAAVLTPAAAWAAQDTTPPVRGSATDPLFSTTLDGLPPAPIPASLARISFAPGSGLSMTANPGPALHFVEEGGFTVLMFGAGTLTRAAATPSGAEPVAPETEFAIGPGDLLAIPAQTPFEVFNTGATPAVALIVEYFAREAGAELPAGIALEPLVVGELTTLPPGAVALALARVTVPPGAAMPPAEDAETVLVSVEAGTASYAPSEVGQVALAAAAATPGFTTVATPGEVVRLDAGDAVIDQRGMMKPIRNEGATPLVLLSLAHRSVGEVATPAP